MSTTLVAALGTAGLLGLTHALEPDHVAAVTSLTGEYGNPRLSALAGVCFSLGHVALVVAWLLVAVLVLGQTEFPPVFDAVGSVGVGVVLAVVGGAMALAGARTVIRRDTHSHDHDDAHDTTDPSGGNHPGSPDHVSDGDGASEVATADAHVGHEHRHVHLHLPGFDAHDHSHDAQGYLKTGLVGAVFTLSPPVSMIVFATTLLPDVSGVAVALAVGSYAVAIGATMGVLGAGAGAVFGASRNVSPLVYAGVRTVAGLAVVGLAVVVLSSSLPTLVV